MSDMRRILERKGYLYHSVTRGATVGDALRVLAARKIGIVLVLEGETLVGVFSERDAIRLAVELGTLPMDMPVREAMTSQVLAVTPDTSVEDCMSLMSQSGIRHVPVMEGSRVVGIVSMRDVVQEVVALRETTIRGLETYIVGGDFLP
jgi:CBS domain-containing protein